MNRNILMLILLVLVLATALIAYNKWIMGDTHSISAAGTPQVVVVSGAQTTENAPVLVEEDISATSSAGTAFVQKSDARSTGSTSATAPESQIVVSNAAYEKNTDEVLRNSEGEKEQRPVLKLVTKKVLVAAATTHKEPVSSKPKKTDTVKPQLSSISSVAYASEKLIVSTAAPFTYRIFGLKEPDRFVIDVIGTFNEELPKPAVKADSKVKSIRLGQHDDRVRIVLDLKRGLPENWSASQGKGQLIVDLKKE